MGKKQIYITDSDAKRLSELIKVARNFGKEDEVYLRDLEEELNRGKVVESKTIPKNVVTMNSKIRIKNLNTKEEMIFQLVFPDDVDSSQDKISVLAPIGTAVIGYKVEDIIEWKVPVGLARLKIEEILYQPEAVGDYHL